MEKQVALNQEYWISKISASEFFRKKLLKLGIERGKKIVIKNIFEGFCIAGISGLKKNIKFPQSYLNCLCLISSSDPDCDEKIKNDYNNINVALFKSTDSAATKAFTDNNGFVDNYKINVLELPSVDSIFGEEYPNKRFRNLIFSEPIDLFLAVVDFPDLELSLIPIIQMLDFESKMVILLRGYDKNNGEHKKTDLAKLSKMLGVSIVLYDEQDETEESKNNLFDTIINIYKGEDSTFRCVHLNYGRQIESFISKIQRKITNEIGCDITVSSRFFAICLLERDTMILKHNTPCRNCNTIKCFVGRDIANLEKLYNNHVFSILMQARKSYLDGALSEINSEIKSQNLDKVFTHKIFGFPIFLMIISAIFYATIKLGKYLMDWIGIGVEKCVDWVKPFMQDGLWQNIVTEGVIGGIGMVFMFLPYILLFFFFIGILENSGYLSRLSFISNKYLYKIGLNGQSLVPCIMGFGCAIPAIMGAKTIDNKRDRLITMLTVPFVSCSARLPIYLVVISLFFPDKPLLILALVYLVGVLMVALISKLFSKTILKSKEASYVMDLQPYSRPKLLINLAYMWKMSMKYLKSITLVIIIGSIAISAMVYCPQNIEYTNDYKTLAENAATDDERSAILSQMADERYEKSYIGKFGHFLEPITEPMGFDWKMNVSAFSGILGRELTVSVVNSLYLQPQSNAVVDNDKMQEDKLSNSYSDVAALSFIFFILLAFPCLSVIIAIWKMSKLKWALFEIAYTLVIAWIISFGIYQIGILIV